MAREDTPHRTDKSKRQPEPDRELDHFTRVDGDFLRWFKESGGVD